MNEELALINLTVNGEAISRAVPVRQHLVDFLRIELELTGSHLGCEHGICGACSVRVDGAVVRGGCEMGSALVGKLSQGQVLRVLEAQTNSDGLLRLRVEEGWVSKCAGDGTLILQLLEDESSDESDDESDVSPSDSDYEDEGEDSDDEDDES